MKKFIIILLTILSTVCACAALSACGSGEQISTPEMQDGYIYITDFSVNYTSASESPNGNINESAMSTNKSVSLQKCYLVIDFSFEMITNNSNNSEKLTLQVTANNADVLNCRVESADTSTTSSTTTDNVTVLTATFTLPEKANTEKSERVVISVTPQNTGTAEINYEFLCDTKAPCVESQCDGYVSVSQDTIALNNVGILEYTLNSDACGYHVTGMGSFSDSQVIIKSRLNGLPVTYIASGAFLDCASLTSVEIPDSVTTIAKSAFKGCTSLTEITIPESVTFVGGGAFNGCSSLISVTLPANSFMNFGEIFGTESYTGGIETRQYYTEERHDSYYIPETLRTVTVTGEGILSYGAFYSCAMLTSVILSDGITLIGNYAFVCCFSLKSINIPDAVTYIGIGAFNSCYMLKSISIPENVTSISDKAFYDCRMFTSITIPSSITSIGEDAFSGCYSLVEVYNRSSLDIKAGDEENGGVAYYAKNVYTPASGGSNIINSNSYIFYNDYGDYTLVGYTGSNTTITLPESINGNSYSLSDYAFYGDTSIRSLIIPDGITAIGKKTFSGCSSLKSVVVGDGIICLLSDMFASDYALESFTIGRGVCYISAGFFSTYQTSLTSVTFLNTDGWYAAEFTQEPGYGINVSDAGTNATNMKKWTWGGCDLYRYSTTSEQIIISEDITAVADYAYYRCYSIKTVVISDSVTSIGSMAFYNCTALSEVYYNGTEDQWNAIENSSSIISQTSATVYYYAENDGYTTAEGNYWYYDDDGNIHTWSI